jgi:hypothetical protein
MPELNEVLGPLVQSTREVTFQMPSEIRRRGERRRLVRRTAITGLVVVGVIGIGVGSAWALNGPAPAPDVATTTSASATPPATSAPSTKPPTPTPTTPPPTTPPPATRPPTDPPRSTGAPATPQSIPTAAMLQPADVGSGYTAFDSQEGDDHGSIPMMMSYCGQGGYTAADDHRVVNRKRNVRRDDQRYVLEEVSRYQNTWAARHLADLRAVLPRCTTVDIMGDPNQRATLAVVDSNFAGDGAILIKETRNGVVQYHAMVRQADVEARLRIHTGATQSQARAIVVAAAARLCTATPTC